MLGQDFGSVDLTKPHWHRRKGNYMQRKYSAEPFLSAVFMQVLTTSAPSFPTSEFVGPDGTCPEIFPKYFLSLLNNAGLQSSEP